MKFAITVLALCGLLSACGEVPEDVEPTLVQQYMADDEALQRGQAIYAGSCANFCHGLTPELASVEYDDTANLFDCQWQYGATDEEIFDSVINGIPNTRMVGFGSNFPEGDDDLWKIIAFLRVNQTECVSSVQEEPEIREL
ncbi:MAG: cytochrome c [Pseudohongiellaceae bacterium]